MPTNKNTAIASTPDKLPNSVLNEVTISVRQLLTLLSRWLEHKVTGNITLIKMATPTSIGDFANASRASRALGL